MNSLIELSELRIGNILSYKGELHYVTHLSMDIDDEYQDIIGVTPLGKTTGEHADWNRALLHDLSRIEISDTFLTRLGYQYANENGQKFYWHVDMPYFQLRHDDISWGLFYCDEIELLISKEDILYVHQLMNIFFFLTGQELKLK